MVLRTNVVKGHPIGPRLGWLGLLLFLWAAPAFAGDDFKTHYQLAIALYQAQHFEDAITEFKVAYQLEQKPGLLFNIAQSYRKAGLPREAIEYYDRYLQSSPQLDTETRRKVDGYLAEARNTLASLELELKRRLAEQKATREQEVKATPPQPDLEPPPPSASPVPAPAAPRAAVVAPTQAPTQTQPAPIYRRWWFWTAIGGVVAAGVVGAVVGTQVHSTPQVPEAYSRGTVIF